MKYILITIILITSGNIYGQSDEIAYQAIITDRQDVPIRNVNTEVQINVKESDPNGAITYTETHNVLTGLRGEIELSIGSGNPINTNFDDINWEAINYIELLVKPQGSSIFFNNGTIELLSVPYAIFATKLGCEQGCPGAPGPEGPEGDIGNPGAPGGTGYRGFTGPQGPRGNSGINGKNGIDTLEKTNEIPTNPELGQFYLDDGTNRNDGLPGFRYYSGSEWINL